MTPVAVPSPAEMAPRWAAFAAALAARGERWSEGCWARPGVWHYDDGGGNWAELVFPGGCRAMLVGHDHEYSATYFREAAAYFDEPDTDLLARCPPWWEPAIATYLDRQRTHGMWIGFIYGFDGRRWSRADYTLDDGFTSLDLPFVSTRATAAAIAGLITTWAAEHQAAQAADSQTAVAALIEAGSDMTADTLTAALGALAPHADLDAGLSAAQAFTQT